MNVAISRRSDDFFKAGDEYAIISFGQGYVELMAMNRNTVRVDMDDNDFVLVFNKDENDKIDIVRME